MENSRIGIITGASSGIGKATALELGKSGKLKLILTGRKEEALAEIRDEINQFTNKKSAEIVVGDILEPAVVEECIEKCKTQFGETPSFFLASAGRGLPGTLLTSEESEWQNLIDVNVKALMTQLKRISAVMLENVKQDYVGNPCDIVVLGSSIGRNVSPFNSVYGATKFATHGLTEALRREIGPKGIRVTLIEPGIVGTNFQESAGYDKEWFESYSKEIGPILTGSDLAEVIQFCIHMPGNVHLDNISIRPTRQAYP